MSELANQIEAYKARRARFAAAGAKHAAKLAEIQAAEDRTEQIKAFELALAGMPKKAEPAPLPPIIPIVETRLTILKIQSVVAEHFGLSRHELTGSKRQWKYTKPRQIACFLAKELTAASFPQIGHRFGGRDHTTVLHSYYAVQRRMEVDPALATTVCELRAELSA